MSMPGRPRERRNSNPRIQGVYRYADDNSIGRTHGLAQQRARQSEDTLATFIGLDDLSSPALVASKSAVHTGPES